MGAGFLVALGMDPSAAQVALSAFDQAVQETMSRAQTSFGRGTQGVQRMGAAVPPLRFSIQEMAEQTDKSLLSNHQSVHLLAEELGIRLPRSVVGAVSEMLPAIGSLGTALLGVFAAKEIFEVGEKLHGVAREFEGVTAAEKRLQEIGRGNLSLLEKAVEGNKKLLLGELQRAQFRAIADEAEAKTERDRFNRFAYTFSVLGMGYELLRGTIGKANEAQNKLTADHELADAMEKILREDIDKEAKAHEKNSKAAHDDAAAEREVQRWREEAPRAVRELTEAANAYDAALQKSANQRIADQTAINKLDLDYLYTLDSLANVQQRQAAIVRSASPAVQLQQEFTAVKHLSGAYSEYLLVKQDAINVGRAFMAAMKDEVQAVNDDMLGSMKNLAEGALALTGSQKAAAAFKIGYEIAEGLACLASGTWPPNPAAIIAAGIHFDAATQYAISAGSGGGGRRSAGAGGGSQSQAAGHGIQRSGSPSGGTAFSGGDRGGSQSQAAGHGIQRSGSPSGGTAFSGGDRGGNTVVTIPGNMSTQGQQQMAAWLGIGAGAGIFKISSNSSSGVPVPSY